jgi:hypothetical protein
VDQFSGTGHSHTVRVYYLNGETEDIPVKESFVSATANGIAVGGVRSDGRPWRKIDASQVDRVHEVEHDIWYTRAG